VASSNNLVEIISQYTQLKPGGGGLMGRCPFPDHPEKTASFSVSEVKQVYHCFGCLKSGNIFKFLEHYNGMSFPESVEYLAHRANIAMPTVDREQSEKLDKLTIKKRQILNANKLAMQFFVDQLKVLPQEHKAKAYAQKRGLTPELMETFKIGYAPAEWDSLIQFLTSKGIPLETMEEARLIKARSSGTGYFDLFRDRLMFTIFDTKNEVIAFGGRILDQGDVKYMNSPETAVFSKSRTLYGLSETAKYIRTEDRAIVVEGYMDLVALYSAGIRNVVAPMGTALTQEQSRLLARLTQNVVVLFDGDDAGKNAAEKSLPILLEANVHPKGLTLPDDLDPDEYISAHGVASLQELLSSVPDLFSMILARWMSDYRGEASQKVQLADRLKPLFRAVADPRLRELYIAETAGKMAVDAKWLKSAVSLEPTIGGGSLSNSTQIAVTKVASSSPSSASAGHGNRANEASIPDKIVLKKATQAEALLMAVALKSRERFAEFLEAEVMEKILDPGAKTVLERAATVYGQEPEKFDKLASLLSTFVDEPSRLFLPAQTKSSLGGWPAGVQASAEANSPPTDMQLERDRENEQRSQEEDSRLLQDCVNRVRERYIKFQAHQISQEIKTQKLSPDQLDPARLEQFMNLQRDRLSLRSKVTGAKDSGLKNKVYQAREDDSEFE
jgi:DNA primase